MIKHNNPASFTSYKIDVLDFIKNRDFEDIENKIATATGFLYKRNGLVYLITNWHVVSERNFWNKREKHSERRPTHLLFTPSFSTSETTVIKDTRAIILNLYDGQGNPNWLIHPRWKNDIDVIAIPIPANIINFKTNIYSDLLAINEFSKPIDLNLSVTDELFVIGYPYGLGSNQKGTLPIWKKCTVASEPAMEYLLDRRPTFLIDGLTNPSMSGSPVIQYIKGAINTSDGIILTQPGIVLHGIYSGRINPHPAKNIDKEMDFSKVYKYIEDFQNSQCTNFIDLLKNVLEKEENIINKFVNNIAHKEVENDTRIGLVWRANLIDEIIDGNQKDNLIYDSDF